MTILNDAFKPNRHAAKEHIRLTIKYYSLMGKETLENQLRIAERGLYIAGFSKKESTNIVDECIEEAGLGEVIR